MGAGGRSMAGKDLTAMLSETGADDQQVRNALLEAVYDELRELADRKLKRDRARESLQPTALVHEAYLRLVDQNRVSWQGRTHFYAVAAQAMQRVLVDHARHRDRQKRGGSWRRVTLDDAYSLGKDHRLDLLALEQALEKMERLDPRQAQIVKLRLFGGLSVDEAAAMLDVSTRTVERDWKMGLAWLRRELSEGA